MGENVRVQIYCSSDVYVHDGVVTWNGDAYSKKQPNHQVHRRLWKRYPEPRPQSYEARVMSLDMSTCV